MTARLLDGKSLSRQLQQDIAQQVAEFHDRTGVEPGLAAVLVGADPASEVYVRTKQRACHRCGIGSQLHRLPDSVTAEALLDRIRQLNSDPQVHGILVQLPLPASINTLSILDAVAPHKDVDCFHAENVGRLMQGRPRFLPCTPHGVLQILERHQLQAAGKHVVIVGRSDIVGKPLAAMFLQRHLAPLRNATVNATVTVCHSRTPNLAEHLRRADIVVAAVGQPHLITGDMLRPGSIIIDVGINRLGQVLVGDVDFESARRVAEWITPVPGGVGPLTVTMLLHNTLAAARSLSPSPREGEAREGEAREGEAPAEPQG